MGRLHRADVRDVPVRRGDDADRLAAAANARGATRGGEVFIPASEGSLESDRARGLLAHELTHVIQQRRLGTAVPLEHSPAGRRLEAEAVMTERHVRGDLGAPAPPPTADPPARAPEPAAGQSDDAAAAIARDIQDELVASGRALRMPDGALVFPGAGGHLPEQTRGPVQPGVPVQHAGADDVVPPEPAVAPVEPSAGPPSPGSAPAFEPAPAPAPVAAAASGAAVASAPWGGPTPAAASEPVPVPFPDSSVPPDAGTSPGQTPAAPEVDLDDLARRVYGRVRTQLRSELLIDRERAGLLTDFR